MRFMRILMPACAAGLAAMSVMLCAAVSTARAENVPVMTVKIINNKNSGHNIYPVLTTGTAVKDIWMQAWFKVPKADLGNKPYPKLNAFRFYINPGVRKNGEWTGDGIAPGKSVTIKIPLFSQLVQDPNPKQTDQFADWWGGGRIEIFDAPAANHAPPAALVAAYTGANRSDQKELCRQIDKCPVDGTPVPLCEKGCEQPLTFFRDSNQFKHNEPILLTEYTLGAINQNKDPFQLNDHNVDYDVSYVDTAYLPAVMVPFDNPQVGYVGSPLPIDTFQSAISRFLEAYPGWPQFVDNQGQTILKLPSVLHLFGSDDPDLTPPPPWKPIKRLIDQWHDCLPESETSALCSKIRTVRDMFQANYDNYAANYSDLGCDKDKQPVELTEKLMIGHVYGWGPFNEHCPAHKNLLENTPGYAKNNHAKYQRIKEKFDNLQNLPSGKFDPYVVLIHGDQYINAPNVYAYSVDDAVGNMQVDATGFMIEVGGTEGLPNPNPATPPIHISLGYSEKDAIRFTEYGVCTDPPNKKIDPDFPSFDISVTSIGACPLTLKDNAERHYIFEVTKEPPYVEFNGGDAHWTTESSKYIDCSSNTDQKAAEWCRNEKASAGVFGYSKQLIGGRGKLDNFIITPPAVRQ
ncbi:MAG: hypothetical protein ACJ8IR_05410 [Alphaproteobacteria bacterium]|jgi:hypothetical protein